MSHRVGRLQQENAKLREEIKRLKGALKDINQDPVAEKPFKEKSPISKDRKKELRTEIESRLNFMMPTKDLLKTAPEQDLKDEKVEDSDPFIASFGQEEEHQGIPRPYQAPEKTLSLESSNLDLISEESIIDKSDSPEFLKVSKSHVLTVDPQVLKDSFSSFYNEESMNKTLQERSIKEEKIDSFNESAQNIEKPESLIENTLKIEKVDFFAGNTQKIEKKPEKIIKNSKSEVQEIHNKGLLSEIEALRQENMKLRLQLTGNTKSKVKIQTRGRSKSKSPIRKTKSRSITPRDLSSKRLKRNISSNTLVGETDLTPRRSRHCNTCDHLLSKGYSTIYCGKHGTAKLK